jgi:DNA-binding SARP family transcriptional activator/tetratricopeptide (TPR) repeat protein
LVEFGVLGPVEFRVAGRSVDLGPGKQRGVLAALLVDAGRVVTGERLIDRVWGDSPPADVRSVVYTHVSRIRRLLAGVGVDATVVELCRRSGGYVLQVEPERVDLRRFRRLVAEARGVGEVAETAAMYRRALGLWRGDACADLSGVWFEGLRAALDGERRSTLADCVDAELVLGRHAELLPELSAWRAAHPLDERLAAQAMLAAYRSGRQAEALACYDQVRCGLADEVGVDPGPDLQRLYQRMLHADPALTVVARPAVAPVDVPAETRAVPAQLPHDAAGFVGRTEHLKELDGLLGSETTAVVISAIAGTAGVGKTALAVHWAHLVADRFPDGQLYVNLRGFDPTGSPMTPAEAVRGFLDAMQVPAQRIPVGLDGQVALYRSHLVGKRLLVVLDNARDAEQVRPLLPGGSGCLVVVTSRHQLPGLIAADGAHPLALDLLTPAEARLLLTRRLGPDRVCAEPRAVEDIITACAWLPLALAIVAARAATHPQFPLAALAEELRKAGGGLDAFTGEDPATDIRAVFSWSYRALSGPAARLFRLLGLHPGADFGTPAAASLAGIPIAATRPLLAELTRAHLLEEHSPGRYTFHDLLRAYATEQTHIVDADDQRDAAVHRMLDHYLHTARAAAILLDPDRDPITLAAPQPTVVLVEIAEHTQAMAWFTTEYPALLAAVDVAAGTGFDTHTWQLAWALTDFQDRRGHWHDWVTTQQAAMAAARRLADQPVLARCHRILAIAYTQVGRLDDAHRHLRQSLDLFDAAGDRVRQAHTHHSIAKVWEKQGRTTEALHHDRQALDLYRAAGHRNGQASTLNSVGWYHGQLGDYRQALSTCQQALTMFQGLGDDFGQAATWDSIGCAHHHLAQHAQALSCYQKALDLFRHLGDRYNEASTLTNLGDTHHAAGNARAARDSWQRALTILDHLDHPDADAVRAKLHALPSV